MIRAMLAAAAKWGGGDQLHWTACDIVRDMGVIHALEVREFWLCVLVAAAVAFAAGTACWLVVRTMRVLRKSPRLVVPLAFAAALCVYAANKPPQPPPVHTEQGIKVTQQALTSRHLDLAWETTDERIRVGADTFVVRGRVKPGKGVGVVQKWMELARTLDTHVRIGKFMCDKTYEIQIYVDKTPAEGEE